ncbi:MAG: hypothetical protein PHT07_23800 [Paludibacter sp.]|nr:hypothetical protein [Paludibacter sp.]
MPASLNRSRPRTQAREAEKKLLPAIKATTNALHNTGIIPDNFGGYKTPAGNVTDRLGRAWQLQIVAVCAKSDFIKKDEVTPIIKGWSFVIKTKAFLKYLIDYANK